MSKNLLGAKVLEIRDRATRIDVLAIPMAGSNPIQAHYFRRAGYPADGSSIMLMVMYNGKATNDPYQWADLRFGIRTMQVAHDYIIRHFAELEDGQVIDVEYVLAEVAVPKQSERIEQGDWSQPNMPMAVSPNHMVLTKNRGFVRVDEITETDEIEAIR